MKQQQWKNLSPLWQKAAVMASLWASAEIILGSFLHNLRVPFAGSFLASAGVVVMVGFLRIWPEKGLAWRAGVICAALKSVSPSALILGPMIGILSEALLMEFSVRLLGRKPAGFLLGGMLGVSSALVHKLISILILYGSNLIQVYINMFNFLIRQWHWQAMSFWELMWILLGIYLLIGLLASLLGYRLGSKARKMTGKGLLLAFPKPAGGRELLQAGDGHPFSLVWLFFHLLFLPAALFFLSRLSLELGLLIVSGYLLVNSIRYPAAFRRLGKAAFWVQLLLLTLFSTFFWNDPSLLFTRFEWQGLWIGLEMCTRALLVVVSFSCLSMEIRNPLVRAFMEKKGMNNLYLSINFSFSTLPAMMALMPGARQFFRHPLSVFPELFYSGYAWFHGLGVDNQQNEGKNRSR